MKTSNVVQDATELDGLSDDAHEMTIDAGSNSFLMEALGKLYSQPARATLREYISNARDSHIEKGNVTRPVEVSLPSTDSPFLIIRDYGTGISEEGFKNVLSRYGASTKRHSNKLTGGFGLGAKSAFALSDKFYMTSYQSGQFLEVEAFRKNGKGFIEIVNRGSTSEPDGLEAKIPVPAGNWDEVSLNSLANVNFLRAFTKDQLTVASKVEVRAVRYGSVNYQTKVMDIHSQSLHNTQLFSPLEFGGEVSGWLSKSAKSSLNSRVSVIIGEVHYTIPFDDKLGSYSSYGSSNNTYSKNFNDNFRALAALGFEVVLNLPIGSCDLPPSREELSYTERTMNSINAVASSVYRMVEEQIQKELNLCDKGHKALYYLNEVNTAGFWAVNTLNWRGKAFITESQYRELIVPSNTSAYFISKNNDMRKSLRSNLMSKFPLKNVVDNKSSESYYTIILADDEDYSDSVAKSKRLISDFHKLNDSPISATKFLVMENNDLMKEWLSRGTVTTLDAIEAEVKTYRSKKRAESKAAKAAASLNPAFAAAPVSVSKAKELFSIAVNRVPDNRTVDVVSEIETSLLVDPTDFYYLSKKEMAADDIQELLNLFPTRRGTTENGSIDPNLVRVLPVLREILGENARIVFLPVTRDVAQFNIDYPTIPSIKDALTEKLTKEIARVKKTPSTTYLANIFWGASNSSKIALMNQFYSQLTSAEKLTMPSELKVLHELMPSGSRSSTSRHKLLMNELFGSAVINDLVQWVFDKIQESNNKFPLLLSLNPVGNTSWSNDNLRQAMLKYVSSC